jgi:hypothetical protein
MTAYVNPLTAAMIDGRGHGPQGSAEIRRTCKPGRPQRTAGVG